MTSRSVPQAVAGQRQENILDATVKRCGGWLFCVSQDQFLGLVLRNNFPMVQDGDPLAQGFSFLHVVRCQHYGHAFVIEIYNEISQVTFGLWIEAGCGFIQKQYFRFVDQRTGNGKSLSLAAG